MDPEGSTAAGIVAFWREAGPRLWFKKKLEFDQSIRARFETAHLAAARGEHADWEGTAEGALALLLLTDQFPRNLYRRSAHAFATDPLARGVAQRALERGLDREVEELLRPFFYLPFSHHEDSVSQARGVELFERHAELAGDRDSLRSARQHAELIARFGRFPHRNAVLGRISTPEEQAYLDGGGFAG